MSEFSDWLVAEMDSRDPKLSLRDVGEPAGVSPTTVRSWRSGFTQPSWENCQGIARALGMDTPEGVARVRELAGYNGAVADDAPEVDPDLEFIVSAWKELEDSARGRQAVRVVVQSLLDSQRARARAESPLRTASRPRLRLSSQE